MESVQLFILTRFNIRIWTQDKNGKAVRTNEWLKQRFDVFERYCLPSIANQTCKDFEWIVLFDNETPAEYKEKLSDYKAICPQFSPVFVEPSKGIFFKQIFRAVVIEKMNAGRIITTYFDNDDALSTSFVDDVQKRVTDLPSGTVVFYPSGFQYFAEFGLMLRVHYKRNHFASVVEAGSPTTFKTIYDYGSHYYVDRIPGVKIEYIENSPLWCEVIHERNMCNDAHFLLGIKPMRDRDTLRREFGIDEDCKFSLALLAFRFVPRYLKTFVWRAKRRLFGRKW